MYYLHHMLFLYASLFFFKHYRTPSSGGARSEDFQLKNGGSFYHLLKKYHYLDIN